MKFGKTERGFECIEFVDRNGVACSLQQSSAIDFDVAGADEHPGSSCIWLGLDGDGLSQTRMHLGYEQVEELNARLFAWLETGSFEFWGDAGPDWGEIDLGELDLADEDEMDVEEAIEVIKRKMREDLDLAWTWQCNIAAFFIDEGGSHRAANQAAARFMKLAFDVDVTKIERWAVFEKQWKESSGV